eukprot:scaffold24298_cov56-Phaeocystis_antarctica.AAC.1
MKPMVHPIVRPIGMPRAAEACRGLHDVYRARRAHARLPHRLLRRHCCRGLLVRVEKLLGDLEHAKLLVAGEYLVVLRKEGDKDLVQGRAAFCAGDAPMYKRELEMRQDGP